MVDVFNTGSQSEGGIGMSQFDTFRSEGSRRESESSRVFREEGKVEGQIREEEEERVRLEREKEEFERQQEIERERLEEEKMQR